MKKSAIKKLLLAGAGHAHTNLLRRLSTERLSTEQPTDTDITLITEQLHTIYSGMLPGWIAGHYHLNDISIDIEPLCRQAGVRLIQQTVNKVDADSQQLMTADDQLFDYDVLSLNTGADTDMRWLSQDKKTALGPITTIRPLSVFVESWRRIMSEAKHTEHYRLAIIGGGAAATELVMAAQVALQRINVNHQAYLICGEHLLAGFDQRFKRQVIKQLERHNIKIIHARATHYNDGLLLTAQNSLPMDAVIAATGVIGAEWTAHTDLKTVDNGFIAVNEVQQSISHANVFAVGDVATRVDTDVAHSGVHAVHGGAIEADNLLAYLADEPLQKYRPKKRTLYLLSCGDKYAIASWGKYSLQGRLVWYLKRRIDKRFVGSYQH